MAFAAFKARTMTMPEAAIAWRVSELSWFLIAGMFVTLALCLMLTKFTIAPFGALVTIGLAAVYGGFAFYNATAANRGNATVVFMLGSVAQAILITGLMTPLSYVGQSAAFPLQDANLARLDQALGLDWRAYLAFVDERPALSVILAKCYAMIGSQILVVPLVLAAVGRFRRLQQYVLALAISLIVTTIVAMFVPALGAYQQFGLTAADHPNVIPMAFIESLTEIPAIRDGSIRHLDLFKLIGVLTFPSFHAATSVLYAWALWPVRWFGPVVMVINFGMLASTPIGGAHYFVDVFAGVSLALCAIAVARYADQRAAERIGGAPSQPAIAMAAPHSTR